ncbi:MAG: TIGR03915 family putative DNA repair protein [Candidatus Riflebacteria bacterium]|nr:TIGR03915 family putative DNA repair protein [Candidatus Riflebacteria bacterium]
MNILRYDGSFYGLICALAPYLYRHQLPDVVERENVRQPALIPTDEEPQMISTALAPGLACDPQAFRLPGVSRESWLNAWHAFLSEAPGIETMIARYLLLAIEKRGAVDTYLTDDRVRNINRFAHRVLAEKHRFMGLLRFRNIGQNLYYASINSDNFVLPLLAPFFVERFADQQWIIHDRRREVAAMYDLRVWTIIERSAGDLPEDSPEEDAAQRLWRCFFDSIAVRERLNLALQQKFIPKKYWSDLIETPGR